MMNEHSKKLSPCPLHTSNRTLHQQTPTDGSKLEMSRWPSGPHILLLPETRHPLTCHAQLALLTMPSFLRHR